MSIDFVTAGKKIICLEKIGTVSIPLADGKSIKLLDTALVPECNSNLISLGQLRETGIRFHDNPSHMMLIRHGVVIAQAKRHRNFFILDRAIPEIVMKVRNLAMATGRGRPTHLVSKNKKVRIWHRRLGHASNARVINAFKLVDGIDIKANEYDPTKVFIDSDTEDDDDTSGTPIVSGPTAPPELAASASETNSVFDHICGPCVGSKSTRVVIRNKSMTPIRERLKEVHADLWGPHYPVSRSRNTYAAILMCEYSQKTWILYLCTKDEFVDAFKIWLPCVETESNCKMGALQADGGEEFVSIKLKDFCKERGIQIRYATPYLHEENGLAEREWRTLVTMKDALLIDSKLPIDFWAKAMETANYLRNRLPTKTRGHGEVIPEEKWSGSRQNLSHLRIFGSEVLVNIPKEKRIKTDIQHIWRGILIGYSNETNKHYRAWAPETKQVIVVSDPFIDESV